jgi:hypothetical protein
MGNYLEFQLDQEREVMIDGRLGVIVQPRLLRFRRFLKLGAGKVLEKL